MQARCQSPGSVFRNLDIQVALTSQPTAVTQLATSRKTTEPRSSAEHPPRPAEACSPHKSQRFIAVTGTHSLATTSTTLPKHHPEAFPHHRGLYAEQPAGAHGRVLRDKRVAERNRLRRTWPPSPLTPDSFRSLRKSYS